MLQLKDVMESDVVAVAPHLTLRELLQVLSDAGVSGAPVVAGGQVLGVISTTDVLEFQEDRDGLPGQSDIRGGQPNDPDADSPGSSRSAPDDWEPEVAARWIRPSRLSASDLLDEYTVADLMTRDILSQPSTATVTGAAGYMLETGVHRLLVIDDDELKGIVTATDIVRAVAQGKLSG